MVMIEDDKATLTPYSVTTDCAFDPERDLWDKIIISYAQREIDPDEAIESANKTIASRRAFFNDKEPN